ncbi:MAG: DUF302 domain-containing protein [Candidatus Poribacteria bacterium]|nr:DUF302 domain-containing protein [Candidatus Poribacteria bacterium]
MGYYISKMVDLSFDAAIEKVTAALKAQGFGVLTEIDVQKAMKDKLNIEFRRYRILGACNPPLAHKALEAEEHIGALLPCNVVVQETKDGNVEVFAADPIAQLSPVGENATLEAIGADVQKRMKMVVESL